MVKNKQKESHPKLLKWTKTWQSHYHTVVLKKPTLLEFNRILDGISYEDTIGHLFIVYKKFNIINPKNIIF